MKEYRNEKGELHRTDGPALEDIIGKYWYINYKRHRTDGPAVEYNNGYKEWWNNGQLHRTDGPAVESSDYKQWWINGKLHRLDGPAVEFPNGTKQWWINDINYTEDQYQKELIKLKLKRLVQL